MRKYFQFYSGIAVALLVLSLAVPAQAYEAMVGPTGVLRYDKAKTFEGYTLLCPNTDKSCYLIDNEGQIVHRWETEYKTGSHAQLLENGHLLRAAEDGPFPLVTGALSGLLQEFDWDGKLVAEFSMKSDSEVSHHTFWRMPNGNTLLLGFDKVSQEQAKKLGRKKLFKPVKFGKVLISDFWLDFIREVDPKGKTVWEWHMIDHLGMGPDKININYELPKSFGLLYQNHDLSHGNTVSYLPETDQVLLNLRNYSEFYLINHKTGEIEYRWGNDTTWNPKAKKPSWGDAGDQVLFGPHNPHRLANGHFLIFDNGSENPEPRRTRIVEMDPKSGKIVWEYRSKQANGFLSHRQGGAQRLPNGNTLICSSAQGHIFEVTPDKKVVWEFVNPIASGKAHATMDDERYSIPPGHGMLVSDVHRAYKYGKNYPAFKGRDLTPQGYIAGDDVPVFYKVWKKGTKVTAVGDGYEAELDDDEEGPRMHAY